MKKIDFFSLLLNNKARMLNRSKYSVPDTPKTILFNQTQILYITSDFLSFHTEELSLNTFYTTLKDLGQKSPYFPYALFKSHTTEAICMSFEQTADLCQSHFISNEKFQVTEYIVSSSESVQIIRVFISGLNVTAQILQNEIFFSSQSNNEQKFKLSFFKSSSKMILSASTAALKQKAMSLYYCISAGTEKKLLGQLALDFIKSGEKYFFIEARTAQLVTNASQKSPPVLSHCVTSPHNSSRELLSTKTLRFNRSDKNRFGTLAKTEEQQTQKPSADGIIYRTATMDVRQKEDNKRSSGLELRSLFSSLEESVKKLEKEKLANPELRSQFEEFLLNKSKSSETLPPLLPRSDSSVSTSKSRFSLRLAK